MKLNFCFSLSLTPRPSCLVFFMRKHTLFEPKMKYSERVNAPLRVLIACILSARKTTFKGSAPVYALFHTDFTFIPNDRCDHPQKLLNHQRYIEAIDTNFVRILA